MDEKPNRFYRIAVSTVTTILVLVTAFMIVAIRFKNRHFPDSRIDEILFYLTNGMEGSDSAENTEMLNSNLWIMAFVAIILALPILNIYRGFKLRLSYGSTGRERDLVWDPAQMTIVGKFRYALGICVIVLMVLGDTFNATSYVRLSMSSGKLFEQNYVDPRNVSMVFPERPMNLIYIYVESMENTIASIDNGGVREVSLIPELEELALDPAHVSFSHTDGLGGMQQVAGTTFTVGAMTAQTAGIPIKTDLFDVGGNDLGGFKLFLPGIYSLGEVLEEQGYNQTFLMGSESSFGARDKLLSQHGNYRIMDLEYVKSLGWLDPDYHEFWGYEDEKLFSYAQTEVTRLAALDEPFNLQILTVDTHFPEGYLSSSCAQEYENQYDNAYACASRLISEFVSWVLEQPFADNTAIIIAGDHLGMQTTYYEDMADLSEYERTVYNVFINAAAEPVQEQNRQFTGMDMYPSTLAAMGVEIDGNRLGLGVALFSGEPTLLESFGSVYELSEEIYRRSEFYTRTILSGSDI